MEFFTRLNVIDGAARDRLHDFGSYHIRTARGRYEAGRVKCSQERARKLYHLRSLASVRLVFLVVAWLLAPFVDFEIQSFLQRFFREIRYIAFRIALDKLLENLQGLGRRHGSEEFDCPLHKSGRLARFETFEILLERVLNLRRKGPHKRRAYLGVGDIVSFK